MEKTVTPVGKVSKPMWLTIIIWIALAISGAIVLALVVSIFRKIMSSGSAKADRKAQRDENRGIRAEGRAEILEARADKIEGKTAIRDVKQGKKIARQEFRACKKGCRSVRRRKGERRKCKRACADTYRSKLSGLGERLDRDDSAEIASDDNDN